MGPKLLYSLPALALALLALILAVVGLSRSGEPDKTASAQASVVKQQAAAQHRYWVVTQAAAEGDKLNAADLAVVSSSTPIPGAIDADQKVAGKVLQRQVRPGELLTQNLFEPGSHLSSLLPIGQRAMAIPVDAVSGAGNLLRPGDHVDVISAFHQSPDNKGPAVLAVLKDIPVLAVHGFMEGQTPSKNDNNRNHNDTVVLSVSEKQLPKLLMASTSGKIRLAIRANRDGADGDVTPSMDVVQHADAARPMNAVQKLPAAEVKAAPVADSVASGSGQAPTSAPLYFDDLFPKAEKKPVHHAAPRPRGQRVEVFEGAETRSAYVR